MKLNRILLNSKQLNSTNQKNIGLLYFIIPLIYALVLFTFIYFNSLEYYAAPGTADSLEQQISNKIISLVKKDIVIANNHELIEKKLFNDLFAEEFHTMITKTSQVDPYKDVSVNEFLLNSGRISEIFVNLHPNSFNMSGYTFNTFTVFNFISNEDAKNIAAFEANDIFPQVGIFDSIKTNLNYISEKIGFGDLFDTVETARSEYIQTRIEEILREQDNNFMDALEANQQNRYALRKNLKEKGASIKITMEDKSKYYEYMTLICESLEYKYPVWGNDFQLNIMCEDTFAKASQYTKNLNRFPFTKNYKHDSKFDYNDKLFVFFVDRTRVNMDLCRFPESFPPYSAFNRTILWDITELTISVLDDILEEIITIPKNKLPGFNIRLNLTELSKIGASLDHPEIVINLFNNFYENKEIILPEQSQVGAFHGPQMKNELNVSNVTNVTILAKH